MGCKYIKDGLYAHQVKQLAPAVTLEHFANVVLTVCVCLTVSASVHVLNI